MRRFLRIVTSLTAKRLLGWQPRPAAETVVDAARSLVAWQAA
ncbi:hypothetical protein [Phytohabitans flavus]|nr:hypothetical protein [Phytohabitans flavus]